MEFSNGEVWALVILVLALLFIFSGCSLQCGGWGGNSNFRWTMGVPKGDDVCVAADGTRSTVDQVVGDSDWNDCCWECQNSGCTGDALAACQQKCVDVNASNPCV